MSQLAAVLNRTLPLSDLEARVTRLEEQVAEQVFAAGAEVEPDSDPGNGSAAPDGTELAEPEEKLGATSEEEVAERTTAASDVEHGAGSDNGAAAEEEIPITSPARSWSSSESTKTAK